MKRIIKIINDIADEVYKQKLLTIASKISPSEYDSFYLLLNESILLGKKINFNPPSEIWDSLKVSYCYLE